MVALYVNGSKVGTLKDAEMLIPKFVAENQTILLRNEDNGHLIGTLTPEPICPWEPDLDEMEIERRCQQKGKPLAEFLQSLGAK